MSTPSNPNPINTTAEQAAAEEKDDFFSDAPLCPMRPANADDDYICEACQ